MKSLTVEEIIARIENGSRFGLFDAHKNHGGTYYFEDGKVADEKKLWEALRTINSLQPGHRETLRSLCPDTYLGTFAYAFYRHSWKN